MRTKKVTADKIGTDSVRMAQFYNNNGKPLIAQKVLPNEACSCGSGKKSKKCCGTITKYYNKKD